MKGAKLEGNLILEKSYKFALRVVKLCQNLAGKKKEFILSKQLLRCGTSIGANIEEAVGAQSRADFFMKITIAYKEARETTYWLRLLRDSEYLTKSEFESIYPDAEEICRILTAIQKTTKKNPKN